MTKSATRVAADKVTFTQTEVTSAVALKAPIASPSFTGNVGVTGTNAAVNVICGGVTEDSNLNFVQGSTTEGGITYDHNSGYASEQMNFRVGNNTTHMSINGAGIVTKPNQPAFSANGTTFDSSQYFIGTGVILANSSYNVSNGRFTAPVSGNYMFSVAMSTADTSAHYLRFHKNGSQVGPTILLYYNQYMSSSFTMIVNMSAGDYMQTSRRGSSYAIHGAIFSGYLIG